MWNILDLIDQWIKKFLIECITGNLNGMFTEVNDQIGGIAEKVGKTPQELALCYEG